MFISGREACFEIVLKEKHLWEVGCGRVYDVKLTFEEDTGNSYFGLRNICFDGMRFLLNGRSVFQRLVLDQGFYPDGIYTAPDEEALQKDIALSQQLGFNGARLHEKVFEPRFLYHCDKAGYLVWGEYPNWGVDISRPEALHIVAKEWLEVLARDVAQMRAELKQAGKKRELSISPPSLRTALSVSIWLALILLATMVGMVVLQTIWSGLAALWSAVRTLIP